MAIEQLLTLINRELVQPHTLVEKVKVKRLPLNATCVKCVNTGQVFRSLTLAAKYCGLSQGNRIGYYLKNKGNPNCKLSGIGNHPKTGELLQWEYVNE